MDLFISKNRQRTSTVVCSARDSLAHEIKTQHVTERAVVFHYKNGQFLVVAAFSFVPGAFSLREGKGITRPLPPRFPFGPEFSAARLALNGRRTCGVRFDSFKAELFLAPLRFPA
jgi:hypothetical protein